MHFEKDQARTFLDIMARSLRDYVGAIDYGALADAKRLILDAEAAGGRLHVTGIGKPGHVSGYAASLFSSTGTPAYQLDGTECVHGSAGQVLPGDVVVAISNSGETSELKRSVECLKANGARIVALTGKPGSWLARNADVALIAGVEQEGDAMNKPPRASILAEMIELQCLSILLQAERGLDPETYVRWHPAGALGASILGTQSAVV
ncbi:carbohydrate isomerase [Granulimonas faecalis]|uniref:Carbohydrate isomerase n=1 Tax=Granulimonas faecalis TaxID=2894155 RepID=A0AAV5AXZ2_9ACTN|nr:SIS domain-containing protein [Granulimonas faecalis]GJM54605.1 carbohydrate isomerase [Granulimonas faecalis]